MGDGVKAQVIYSLIQSIVHVCVTLKLQDGDEDNILYQIYEKKILLDLYHEDFEFLKMIEENVYLNTAL